MASLCVQMIAKGVEEGGARDHQFQVAQAGAGAGERRPCMVWWSGCGGAQAAGEGCLFIVWWSGCCHRGAGERRLFIGCCTSVEEVRIKLSQALLSMKVTYHHFPCHILSDTVQEQQYMHRGHNQQQASRPGAGSSSSSSIDSARAAAVSSISQAGMTSRRVSTSGTNPGRRAASIQHAKPRSTPQPSMIILRR